MRRRSHEVDAVAIPINQAGTVTTDDTQAVMQCPYSSDP
jgi:hypothetical protein